MRNSCGSEIQRQLQTLLQTGTACGLTDGELLDRFRGSQGRGTGAELAFATLLARHGPMVLRVCRNTLRDHHDAEDAFQATFLLLARKADTVRRRDTVGPYLHAVALRVAASLRTRRARRQRHEAALARQVRETAPDRAGDTFDLGPILHEEIARLPSRFQSVSVLCDLEGKTYAAAAEVLKCPIGTVMSRLAEARRRLRLRLTRRGVGPGIGIGGALGALDAASAAVPVTLRDATLRAAIALGGNQALIPGVVSSAVLTLGEDVLKAMLLTKLKVAAGSLLIAGVVAAGAATTVNIMAIGAPAAKPSAHDDDKPAPAAQEETPSEPARALSDQFRNDVALLHVRLVAKHAELARAQAQHELTLAIVATNTRLNERRKGMVSAEDMRRAESEAKVADAEIAIAQAEVQEVELLLDQAKRVQDHPDQIKAYLDRARSAGAESLSTFIKEQRRLREVSAGLERHVMILDQKLDRILRALEGPKSDIKP